MDPFLQHRHNCTTSDGRVRRYLHFHNTGIKAYSFVVDEKSVSSARIREAAVYVNTHEVIGAYERSTVDHSVLKEHFPIQCIKTERIGCNIHDACPFTVIDFIKLSVVFILNSEIFLWLRITDDILLAVFRNA